MFSLLRRRFSIESRLPVDETIARLERFAADEGEDEDLAERQTLRGSKHEDRFEFNCQTGGPLGLRPRVAGRVEPSAEGSRISGTIQLPQTSLLFLSVWTGLVLLGVGVYIIDFLGKGWHFSPAVPFTVMVFGQCAFVIDRGSRQFGRVRNQLAELVEAAD